MFQHMINFSSVMLTSLFTNMRTLKLKNRLQNCVFRFIITITSNESWNTETRKRDRNPPMTNHNPWPFEPVKEKFCFLRGPLRWLTAAKNAIVSWLLNFRIRMFVKSAVKTSFPIILFRFLETNVCWNRSSYAMNVPLTFIFFFCEGNNTFP